MYSSSYIIPPLYHVAHVQHMCLTEIEMNAFLEFHIRWLTTTGKHFQFST